ncbi:protein SMG8 [Trichogramma pretiosum]|uniref:protein SMG8 n=1 Tax=Trichogramma pretiosum TaxID=7493 RepID=UPI0006C9A6B9|nr:protein SMG8 [Trichogramma pretiosum]
MPRPPRFIVPHEYDASLLPFLDENVVVVSIFGKSTYKAKSDKSKMVNSILVPAINEHPTIDNEAMFEIEGYFDQRVNAVFLHLKGCFDAYTLSKQYNQFVENMEKKDFLHAWANMKDKYSRALLTLFHISHILILTHPTHTFDYSYIPLFKALEIVREKAGSHLREHLESKAEYVSEAWVKNTRPCSPRMLFYFERCPPVFQDPNSEANITKLEHSLEDSIYEVLRKNKIVNNNSSNSLFAIPVNQEFVFVNTEEEEMRDVIEYMHRGFAKACAISEKKKTESKLNNKERYKYLNYKPTNPMQANRAHRMRHTRVLEPHEFDSFVQRHINMAFSTGFDDNVGRNPAPAYFETPTLAGFFEVAGHVHDFFVHGRSKEVKNLEDLLNTDVKFSRSRCSKIMPRACAAYQEGLPQHYTRSFHEQKLAQAMAVFEMQARGPLYDEFAKRLQEECDKHWRTGRQMCQVLSLTGNPCTNPLHKGGSEGAGGGEPLEGRDDYDDLKTLEHCSGVRYVCACNCGATQGSREDPFNVKQANHDYFQMLGLQCGCHQLESHKFPIFQPSTPTYRAAQLFDTSSKRKDSLRSEGAAPTPQQGPTQVFSLGVPDEVTAYGSGGQSPPAQSDHHQHHHHHHHHHHRDHHQDEDRHSRSYISDKLPLSLTINGDSESKVVIAVTEADPETKDKSLNRQPSTTEYLPGMLHTESPAGLLPQFSSWSLVCLGSSSIYSHNIGLQHQQGMLPNSAFLLPWDVTVRLEHQQQTQKETTRNLWQASPAATNENSTTTGSSNANVSNNNGGGGNNFQQLNFYPKGAKNTRSINPATGKRKRGRDLVVKIFIGIEYECPRGHRFMMATPDKVLKATGIGTIKDNGNKVTSGDMPLYFPCPCRQQKPLIAQLMRIHVVTPKAPVHVTLNPKVQTGPQPSPIFVTGCEEPMKLSQSAYWILRLPYVYMGDKGPCLPPKELGNVASHGRLLAGMYGISEAVNDKK